MDFHCLDTGTGNVDVRIQASDATAGSNFTGSLSFCGLNFYLNGIVNIRTNTLTCAPVNATTGTFSGTVSCGGTLTCGSFSVKPTNIV